MHSIPSVKTPTLPGKASETPKSPISKYGLPLVENKRDLITNSPMDPERKSRIQMAREIRTYLANHPSCPLKFDDLLPLTNENFLSRPIEQSGHRVSILIQDNMKKISNTSGEVVSGCEDLNLPKDAELFMFELAIFDHYEQLVTEYGKDCDVKQFGTLKEVFTELNCIYGNYAPKIKRITTLSQINRRDMAKETLLALSEHSKCQIRFSTTQQNVEEYFVSEPVNEEGVRVAIGLKEVVSYGPIIQEKCQGHIYEIALVGEGQVLSGKQLNKFPKYHLAGDCEFYITHQAHSLDELVKELNEIHSILNPSNWFCTIS